MKNLIVYYSLSGNTEKVANIIRSELKDGADIAVIETVKPYEGSYQSIVDQGHDEVRRGFCPEIKPMDIDLSAYGTVIIGTPVWWYTFAPAVGTFLKQTDLSGKRIVPFATNGGWLGHTFKDIAKACPNSKVENGLNVRFSEQNMRTSEKDIIKFAQNI